MSSQQRSVGRAFVFQEHEAADIFFTVLIVLSTILLGDHVSGLFKQRNYLEMDPSFIGLTYRCRYRYGYRYKHRHRHRYR